MPFSARTLHDLAYADVLVALAGHCRTDAGRERARQRPFLEGPDAVRSALALVEEARALLARGEALPLGGVFDVRDNAERAAKGALLEPAELHACAQTLFAFRRLRQALEAGQQELPALFTLSRALPDLETLAARLEMSLEADGTLSERASPTLREARGRVRGLHRAIKGRLEALLREPAFTVHLREAYYSVRNGRYVLPVLAQDRAEVPGIVHNASQTGQTLFVEPQPLVGLGNDLAIAESLVLEEERRVLQELSGRVGAQAEALASGVAAAAELDEAEAAARLAQALDAAVPGLEAADGPLSLLQLRHPLLALRGVAVVPNDVQLLDGVRALVISGPNAGGKTVTLTAVGLCALLLRAGLPIPAAAGSRVPLYTSVHSAVGDAQDLGAGLSTFSAHLGELKRIAEAAGPGSLVLIDEIAADTDPREGAALAIALLEELLQRGARALVTTHLEELKALTHVDGRFLNARVGFDARRMAPTYRLQLGAAGSSSALELAERMGLSPEVVARARALATGAGGPLSQALAALEAERRELAASTEAARKAAAEASARAAQLEQQARALEEESRAAQAQATQARAEAAERSLAEVTTLLETLRKSASVERAEEARTQLAAQAKQARARAEASRLEQARGLAPPAPSALQVGARVHHLGLGRDVELLALEGEEAVVAAGSLKLRVPKEALAGAHTKASPHRQGASARRQAAEARAQAAAAGPLEAGVRRCDVRGLRTDEALREVEGFLDRAFRDGESSVLLVHGHGTGALRQALRAALSASAYVHSHQPGDAHQGGDGVTRVTLRDE
ncbi:MAG: endonuclease MutS2 [Myxococcaceae bacterium]